MFIQTESTPNPTTLKFLPGRIVLPQGTLEFHNREEAAKNSPLAAKLFNIPNIKSVFLGYDFITITKNDGEWQHLKPAILGTIMEHFLSNDPVITTEANLPNKEFFDEKDTDIVVVIKELLETRVRPAVANDGGDITFCGFENGIVYLNMRGACAGCPSSTATLKHGIENLLRHFIPEVLGVEAMPQNTVL
ncbi:Fe-S cluster biogenesis protein NfuA, 4Fe-4S-binding domain [Bartonella sp. CDC_skunk]|uniref:NifU family protein n=1 Tax=Bartonella TaxID=773 RepID=UPI00099AC8ED|nr:MULTISPECIES: NifU family protein [unclassified Bartonella]AQX18642.1 Fe-S cluster biogenesis protein NfuA, 4Fe-4S-binding domain [Bartonella sp. A1379B]AQX21646.1 Fe-S cluster biogenesis protein NfuA, 4Fe-4S-binding domain [Bartonella sp. CDC_skunk]AQX23156.1 Fe-S cluster biogenesis protein NfuA, 4Fe-4S-binding domain [Bartonella sp. 11B]AQX23545.1 Fe-S cluster biogenesis protein NfuA, 4Fe-4S-binding domain [Bartonella sp. 114]AQX25611.1 Fe-S cluster biogenesis protein NfuA, 4Fe-4S-binding